MPVERSQPDWQPEGQDVADLLLTRARTPGGGYIGNFTTATEPNADQVIRLIEKATDRVVGRLGADLDGNDAEQASDLAAIGAAMFVELAFFPSELDTDRSPYQELKALWDAQMGSDGSGGDGSDGGVILPPGSRNGHWYFDPVPPIRF